MRNIRSFLKWVLVWTSTWSMLMSPLAMGQQAKKISRQEMQGYINQLGLNKSITAGEFYQKNKHLFPKRIQKDVEAIFMTYKNAPMPSFEVTTSKNTLGEDVPVIRVTSVNGELINMQWLGEKDRLMKFQNTFLSEVDMINFQDAAYRVMHGEEKLRNQVPSSKAAPAVALTNKEKFRHVAYPKVNAASWNKMSAREKANYVVTMRQLWSDAREVLRQKEAIDQKKKKRSQFFEQKYQDFFSFLHHVNVGTAFADNIDAARGGTRNYDPGQSCIIAGYVAERTSSGGCNYRTIDAQYSGGNQNSIYSAAKGRCTGGQIACNPYVFGTPGGNPICVTPEASSSSAFQTATHWDGLCDSGSKLSTTQIEVVRDSTRTRGRFDADNMSQTEEERTNALRSEQATDNFRLTEEYLAGLLKFRGLNLSESGRLFQEGQAVESGMLQQIVLLRDAFDNEIRTARASCQVESDNDFSHERNYWQACDNLYRRQLFVNELFTAKCTEGGGTLSQTDLMCTCPSGQPSVAPGARCAPAAPVTPPPTPPEQPATTTTTPPPPAPPAEQPEPAARPARAGSDCNWLCQIGRGVKTALPWLLAIGAAYGIYKLIPKNTVAGPQPAPDACPNGLPAPCLQTCTPPLASINGQCACTACPPGTSRETGTATNPCPMCTSTPPPTNTYTCPDLSVVTGGTESEALAKCPTYSCWNGNTYSNPMNCPPQDDALSTGTGSPAGSGGGSGTGR